MKQGDLVWHFDDIKDGVFEPGLVTEVQAVDSIGVYFFDSQTLEVHEEHELTTRPPNESR